MTVLTTIFPCEEPPTSGQQLKEKKHVARSLTSDRLMTKNSHLYVYSPYLKLGVFKQLQFKIGISPERSWKSSLPSDSRVSLSLFLNTPNKDHETLLVISTMDKHCAGVQTRSEDIL